MSKPMEPNELQGRLLERRLTRRQMHRVLAGAGVATFALPLMPRAVRADVPEDDALTVFEWAGYEDQNIHQPYVRKHGKTPAFTFFGEEEEAMQKMRAGFRVDISHPCSYSTGRWRDAGLLKPVDTSRIESWGDLFPNLKTLRGGTADGKTWFLPFDWGNSSVLYRTDLVDPEYVQEESWGILFDERYKKRLAIYDSVDGVMGVVGAMIGAKDTWNMTDEELEKAAQMLRAQQKLMRFYWTDQTAVEQGLASGELVAAYAWNDAYDNLKKQGIPVAYMKPKEGIYTWVCGFVLIEGGEGDPDKAYDYLNAVLAPESGAYVITEFNYGHSNQKAFDLVPKDQLEEIGISDPVSHIAGSNFFDEIQPEVREKYIRLFEEIKAGG